MNNRNITYPNIPSPASIPHAESLPISEAPNQLECDKISYVVISLQMIDILN